MLKTVLNVLKAFGGFLLKALPVSFAKVKADIDKVAPQVQAEIDRILGDAKVKVEALKADHSVASIRAQAEADVKAVFDTANHHVSLIKQLAEAQIAGAVQNAPPALVQAVADVKAVVAEVEHAAG